MSARPFQVVPNKHYLARFHGQTVPGGPNETPPGTPPVVWGLHFSLAGPLFLDIHLFRTVYIVGYFEGDLVLDSDLVK